MADDARVPKTQITGIYGGLLKVAMRKMLGQVPESAEVMWHNPRVFKDLMGFGRKAENWDRIDPNLASFASMAAASQIGCSFCLDLGYFMSHNRASTRPRHGRYRGGGSLTSSLLWSGE